jgi:hypothetical protein
MIIKSVDQVKPGQEIGITYTHSGYVYKKFGKIVSVKGNTIRIDIGEKYTFPYSFKKSTKGNHVFAIPQEQRDQIIKEINQFNAKTQEVIKLVTEAANQYWTERINKAEEQQKKQGVYVESEVYSITGNGLKKEYNTYGVSV